jgi:hypothetical protein
MFFVPINIQRFVFSPSKKFLRKLVPKKFSVLKNGPYFLVNSCISFESKQELD